MEQRLTGKVALVTGASRGMGAAIAKRLAAEGAVVAITYSASREKAEDIVKTITASGGKALALQADSGSAEAVKAAVAQTVKTFGTLDILVNNAGIVTIGAIDDVSLDDFDRIVAVNVKGLFVATQEAARHMKQGGRIINIGSVNSDSVPFANFSVYAMTKGAVSSLTRGLARDLGPRGITINNIQPGPIDTDMNPAEGELAPTMSKLTALGHYGEGDDVAGMVAYLASPEGKYITGANLKIDGGFSA